MGLLFQRLVPTAMNGTGVITVVLTLLTARAGAFVASPLSGATDASCVSPAVRSGGTSSLAELPYQQRHRRERQQQRQQKPNMILFSSRQHQQHTSQQRQRRRRGRAGSDHLQGGSTSIMNMHPGSSEGEDEDHRPQPRLPREQHKPPGRGQQTRADFLRAGASLAGLTAVVLGAQQEVLDYCCCCGYDYRR